MMHLTHLTLLALATTITATPLASRRTGLSGDKPCGPSWALNLFSKKDCTIVGKDGKDSPTYAGQQTQTCTKFSASGFANPVGFKWTDGEAFKVTLYTHEDCSVGNGGQSTTIGAGEAQSCHQALGQYKAFVVEEWDGEHAPLCPVDGTPGR